MSDREIAMFALMLAFCGLWDRLAGVLRHGGISTTKAYAAAFFSTLVFSFGVFGLFLLFEYVTNG